MIILLKRTRRYPIQTRYLEKQSASRGIKQMEFLLGMFSYLKTNYPNHFLTSLETKKANAISAPKKKVHKMHLSNIYLQEIMNYSEPLSGSNILYFCLSEDGHKMQRKKVPELFFLISLAILNSKQNKLVSRKSHLDSSVPYFCLGSQIFKYLGKLNREGFQIHAPLSKYSFI